MEAIKYRCALVKEEAFEYSYKVLNPNDAVKLFNDVFHASEHPSEHVYEICTDIKGGVVGMFQAGQGTNGSSIIDAKGVVRNALLCNAVGVIIAHNHPSGSLELSDDDIYSTRKIKEALRLFDIILSDHIIITLDEYKSMKEEGAF